MIGKLNLVIHCCKNNFVMEKCIYWMKCHGKSWSGTLGLELNFVNLLSGERIIKTDYPRGVAMC